MKQVRVLTWNNLEEVCRLANLNPIDLAMTYQQSLEANDGYIVVVYDDGHPIREPFEAPYSPEDLPELDGQHAALGSDCYDEWMASKARRAILGE